MKRPSAVFYACLVGLLYLANLLLASIWVLGLATLLAYLVRRFVFETHLQLPVPQNGAVLITGTSTGIGKELSFHFAKRGFLVFATVRKTEDAERLHRECPENKHLLKTVIMDTTNDDHVRDAVEIVRTELKQSNKQLFCLICNAGVAETYPIETTTRYAFDKMFGANVYGTISTVRGFAPMLREYTGEGSPRILITSSLAGFFATQGLGMYCASKHALEAIGDALRIELRFWSIKVSVIEPGTFESPMIHDIQNESKYELEQYTPMIKNFNAAFGLLFKYFGIKTLDTLVEAIEKVALAKYPPARRAVGYDTGLLFVANCLPDSVITLCANLAEKFGQMM